MLWSCADKGKALRIPIVAARKIFSHFVKIVVDKPRLMVYNSHVRWFTMGGIQGRDVRDGALPENAPMSY